MHTKHLWVQDLIAKGEVGVRKIGGIGNPADILTKYHGNDEVAKRMRIVNVDLTRN